MSFRRLSTLLAALALAVFLVPAAHAQAGTFEVTITNLTAGQVMSPPVVVSHDGDISLFTAGQPASSELAQLAEDGFNDPLVALLEGSPDVFDVAVGGDVIVPGGSMTISVEARGNFRLLSLAGMLVTTNDTFFAINSLRLDPKGNGPVYAMAWDAGSEGDSELCEHIPGPPCDNPFVPNLEGAEGYVHIDGGIHGIGDLAPADNDWRNPVALVTVERVN